MGDGSTGDVEPTSMVAMALMAAGDGYSITRWWGLGIKMWL